MNIGFPEILLFLLIIVLLFGARKLPELARSLGRSLGEFKKGKEEGARLLDDEEKKSLTKGTPPSTA